MNRWSLRASATINGRPSLRITQSQNEPPRAIDWLGLPKPWVALNTSWSRSTIAMNAARAPATCAVIAKALSSVAVPLASTTS